MTFVDKNDKPVHVVDRFAAAVILSSAQEIITTSQDKIVRVPALSQLVAGSDDGTLLGPDKKKVGFPLNAESASSN